MLSLQCQSRTGGPQWIGVFELVLVPLADVDPAKASYVDQVGFGVEQDVQVDENHRFVELMPPGSPCSIALTTGDIDSEPGSRKGVQLNVESVDEAHAFLHVMMLKCRTSRTIPRAVFCFFSDPDGNDWSIHGPLRAE